MLDPPTSLLREAAELGMRVHRNGLVSPFESGLVRRMVGIEADVSMQAFETRFFDPFGDHPHLRGAVAILASDLCMDAVVEADHGSRSEDDASAFRFVARNCLSGTWTNVRTELGIGEPFDERLKLAWMDMCADQQMVIDLLEARAVD